MVNADLLYKYRALFPGQLPLVYPDTIPGFSTLTKDSSLEDFLTATVKMVNSLKTEQHHAHLGGVLRSPNYQKLQADSQLPDKGQAIPEIYARFKELTLGHPFQTEFYMTNAIPVPTKISLAAHLLGAYLNSNPVFDVYGPAAYEAEVEAIVMMAEVLGFEKSKAGGYFTSGGTGGNKAALRIGIQKAGITELNPDEIHRSKRTNYREEGIPPNLYVFSNELAHFSVDEVVASSGLGTKHNIKVKSNKDNSINVIDLEQKMCEVLRRGGLIAGLYATVGTTDSFGMDDVSQIKVVRDRLVKEFNLPYVPHLHADMANGGFFTMFNEYDFERNPLQIEPAALDSLLQIKKRMHAAREADSAIFDFHKFGFAPYLNSLFLVKDAADHKLVDRDENISPYIGSRSYSQHHTGYTEECSRISASLPAVANLRALGREGYQVLLANAVERAEQLKSLLDRKHGIRVLNRDFPGPIVNFRFYDSEDSDSSEEMERELDGRSTAAEIQERNLIMDGAMTFFGKNRARIFLGDTKRYRVAASSEAAPTPLYALKSFLISPYTSAQTIIELTKYLCEGKELLDSQRVV